MDDDASEVLENSLMDSEEESLLFEDSLEESTEE